jgi:hypothetical protein
MRIARLQQFRTIPLGGEPAIENPPAREIRNIQDIILRWSDPSIDQLGPGPKRKLNHSHFHYL